MKNLQSTVKSLVLLFFVVSIFIGFGIYHISKFETSDEHFWRLERVPQYWTAISQGNLKKTYINDKPGVSIALVSGLGLPFISQDRSDYSSVEDYTMTLNTALRLPILLFNGLVMLPLLFWLLMRAFDRRIASIGIILIGVNPILIGISQIINPDALLWSFSTGALLAFFALLKSGEKKFIVLTGVLTGFALLSKYTANLLFVFYIMIFISWIIYTDISDIKKWIHTFFVNYLFIFLIAVSIFAIFLPATLLDSSLFLYGTILSPPLKPIILPLSLSILLLFIDSFLFDARVTTSITKLLRKMKTPILYLSILPLLFLMIFAVLNAWTDATLVPLDNLKEVVANKQKLEFPMLEGLPAPIYFVGEITIQSFNILFSLTPLILIFTIVTIILIFLNNLPKKYHVAIIFCAITPFFFFAGGILTETFVNTRYAIMLVPLFALMASIGLSTIFSLLTRRDALQCVSTTKLFTVFIVLLLFMQGLSVYLSAPYYFNYQNIFLPQKFILTDSWSYGIFESVQYLNSLPDAKNITIWSDRKAACYYFIGDCIMRRKLDAVEKMPDYFIVTRRGVLRHHFKWLEPDKAPYTVDSVYTDATLSTPLWQFNILDRPSNYIKIIDAQTINSLK